MKLLFKNLKKVLKIEKPKMLVERDNQLLVGLAHKLIFLLLETNEISIEERQIIYDLVATLEDCTQDTGADCNTCDYKIARELVMKFPGNDFRVLKSWINQYWYDHRMVNQAIDEMVIIDFELGLVEAIQSAQPGHIFRQTRQEVVRGYWRMLKQSQNLTFDLLKGIAVRTDMDSEIQKECIDLIFERDLLCDHRNEKYYTMLFKNERISRAVLVDRNRTPRQVLKAMGVRILSGITQEVIESIKIHSSQSENVNPVTVHFFLSGLSNPGEEIAEEYVRQGLQPVDFHLLAEANKMYPELSVIAPICTQWQVNGEYYHAIFGCSKEGESWARVSASNYVFGGLFAGVPIES